MSDEWRFGDGKVNGFRCFLRDMGPLPSAAYTVERVNNNGPYSADNCVWATMLEQQNNRRSSAIYSYKGVTGTIAQICRYFGNNPRLVRQRMNTQRWSLERAMEAPVGRWASISEAGH